MDCYICEKEIGSVAEPIFVVENDIDHEEDVVCCRECYRHLTGLDPNLNLAQLDPDLCTEVEIAQFFAEGMPPN